MEHTTCANCNTVLKGNFCHHCGQKADMHRLSMRHFIEHDLIHGIWHVDRGILKTVKDVLIRPGYLARDYIAGKRTGHFNLVTLLVLLATFFLFTTHPQSPEQSNFRINGQRAPDVVKFVSSYAKWILLIVIPILALASGKTLRRLKYNYAERLVMSGYFIAGALVIMILFRLLNQIPGLLNGYVLLAEALFVVAFLGYALVQVIESTYSKTRSIWLSFLTLCLFLNYTVAAIAGVLTIYYFIFIR